MTVKELMDRLALADPDQQVMIYSYNPVFDEEECWDISDEFSSKDAKCLYIHIQTEE